MTADLLMIAGTWKGDGNWLKRGQWQWSNEKPIRSYKKTSLGWAQKGILAVFCQRIPSEMARFAWWLRKKDQNPFTVTPHSDKLTNIERVTEQTVTTPVVPQTNVWDEGKRIYSPIHGSCKTQVVFLFKETISMNQTPPAQTSAPISLIFKCCQHHRFWKMQENQSNRGITSLRMHISHPLISI